MRNKTPWSQGSLPSDSIRRANPGRGADPSYTLSTQPSQTASNSRGKTRAVAGEPPKSKKIIRLEALVEGLSESSLRKKTVDPLGGCFCQARTHLVSPYTPLCQSCGLIICELHQPFWICPDSTCASPLLTLTASEALRARLASQIAATLVQEEQARQRAIEDARAAEGAFPPLASAGALGEGGGLQTAHPVNQTHKVVSISGKKGGRVTVTSYAPSAAASRPSSSSSLRRGDDVEVPEVRRVPAPPAEVEPVGKGVKLAVYVASSSSKRQDTVEGGGAESSSKKKKDQ